VFGSGWKDASCCNLTNVGCFVIFMTWGNS
jgi:hypothetical protein